MPMIMPPKEILKNVKCRNNSVYLVGEVTEEQKKIFQKFKKEVEDVLKKAELKQTDCLYINRKASQNIAQALCSVSFILCGAFSYKVKKGKDD
ncbi:MAG: hypothetical protein ACLR1R_04110 [Ruminococcus callidus]